MCGLGVGEGRQDTQDRDNDDGKKKGRCNCTGTPTFGLPPVFSGPVALFMLGVYEVFVPMILQVAPWAFVGWAPYHFWDLAPYLFTTPYWFLILEV